MTSAPVQEARANGLASGREDGGGRGRRREAGQREDTPPSASLGQWKPPAVPRLRERYEKRCPGKVRAEPERRLDHRPSNTATSPAARYESREENRHAPRDRRRRGLPLQSPEDTGLRE